MLKNKIKRHLFHFLFEIGYLPPKKALSPKKVYQLLKYKSFPAVRYQLKNSTKDVLIRGDQGYYEALLKAFVPNWNIPINERSFMGLGSGAGSLNVYRKVKIDRQFYFEKVYFNFLPDLERAEWFLSNIYGTDVLNLRTPTIKQKYTGELLTIVYYDYFQLRALPDISAQNKIMAFSKKLYKASPKALVREWYKTLPAHLKTFSDIEYDIGITMAKKRLEEKQVNVNQLETQAAASRHVLTHGDLSVGNVWQEGVVIDWDTFGIYPIGFECARFFSNLKSSENFMNWLIANYKSAIDEMDWEDFKRNACYYFYILSLGKDFFRMKGTEQEGRLIEELKKY